MSDISISSDGRDSSAEFLQKLTLAEAGGAHTFWIANHLFLRDPMSLAALSLARTERIRLALMAVSPFTIHPVQTAMAAATLDEFYPGRVTVCLGVGAPADLKAIGIDASKPFKAMREALTVMRELLSGETVRFQGSHFSIAERGLASGKRDIPLVLAASGPSMLELAGAAADGVMISAGSSVEFVKRTLETVDRGAKGRKVRTHALIYTAVGDSETEAHDRLRRVLAILLRGPHHAANLEAAGSSLDQDALNKAVLAGDWPRAEAMITDDIVRRHGASGTPARVQERLNAYYRAGLDEIVVAGARESGQISKILDLSKRAT